MIVRMCKKNRTNHFESGQPVECKSSVGVGDTTTFGFDPLPSTTGLGSLILKGGKYVNIYYYST